MFTAIGAKLAAFFSATATKLVIAGIAVTLIVSGALYIRHVIAENATLQYQLDDSLRLNRKNVEAFNDFKLDMAAAEKAIAGQHQADLLRLANAGKLKQEIAHAKPADDGPVAAVLAHTLDGLRSVSGVQPGPSAN